MAAELLRGLGTLKSFGTDSHFGMQGLWNPHGVSASVLLSHFHLWWDLGSSRLSESLLGKPRSTRL